MDKYAILLAYYDKQWHIIERLYREVVPLNLSLYETRYLFAMKTQQWYTAVEDLLKQIAKGFENHIEELSASHKELLIRLHTEIPKIRPQLLSKESFLLLDKVRSFRHFVRHAYDCELDEAELREIQNRITHHWPSLEKDVGQFRRYLAQLAD